MNSRLAMLSFVIATTAPLRDGVAAQTNALQTAPTPIKTTFIEAAKLSEAEVAQVTGKPMARIERFSRRGIHVYDW